ncbi:MAG: hypothetical protein DI570_21135 [Phenylobacterium zucineum]|nr:MAG: hypothetical protein DI570_21135 [Phenylobacterium zucineum]
MNDNHLFAFEDDFVATLRCIPMAVRLKLDRSGIKLTLRQWSRFTPEDRRSLLNLPCASGAEVDAYRGRLIALVAERAGEDARPLPEPPSALWEAAGETPPVVTDYARTVGVPPPTGGQWRRLSELQRFVLVKLTRDNHDNVNFVPALREFGLA